MKKIFTTLTSGLIFLFPFNLYFIKQLNAQNLPISCSNYPYDFGIDLKQRENGLPRLLSTSVVNIRINHQNSISKALREANLRAKLNISKFQKLTHGSNKKNILDMGFPVRINGRVIKSNTQLLYKIKKELFGSSDGLRGVINLSMCHKNDDYVMVTLEMTNITINAADFIKNNN